MAGEINGDEFIYLSPPDVGERERQLLLEAFDSNWIAPLGPFVDRFEREFAQYVGVADAAALSSGTAALHLALELLGVGPGDRVVVPTLTFAATVNAVRYVDATPIFVDSERRTWNMDPALLERTIAESDARGELPKAVVVVDIYGQCAEYDDIRAICSRWDIPIVEDAAEALGATYDGRPAGTLGDIGVFSFNGNKIITTSGGGMLISARTGDVDEARALASQAREATPWYEHTRVGYNYRLSNLLAAVGVAQLERIDDRVHRRREINSEYRQQLAGLTGIDFMPRDVRGNSSCWLTCLTLDPQRIRVTPEEVRQKLLEKGIEVRHLWKPMHMQPAFRGFPSVEGAVSRGLFERGLCLPSGSALTPRQVARVVDAFKDAVGHT